MADISEILCKYSSGKMGLEETNAALEEAGASFRLNPERNTLTDQELDVTFAGWLPEEAYGWGLLDTGTGTLDKVRVVAGNLDHAVNQVMEDGSVNMTAYVLIGGKRYEVMGDKLAEVTPRKGDTQDKLPKTPDMRRRSDLAEQEVVQHTRAGDYRISYDEFGYAVKAVRAREE